eukprot:1143638-Pelagomonas_calceolata.AAC.1
MPPVWHAVLVPHTKASTYEGSAQPDFFGSTQKTQALRGFYWLLVVTGTPRTWYEESVAAPSKP